MELRYAALVDDGHQLPAVPYKEIDPIFYRQRVENTTGHVSDQAGEMRDSYIRVGRTMPVGYGNARFLKRSELGVVWLADAFVDILREREPPGCRR